MASVGLDINYLATGGRGNERSITKNDERRQGIMFRNVGAKIKTLAELGFWISIVIYIIGGIALLIGGALVGILIIIAGALISCPIAWFLYAFGQLVDDVAVIAEYSERKLEEDSTAIEKIDVLYS